MKRFWSKVDIRGPDECWEWSAFRRNDYGVFRLNGRIQQAHRVAWELTNGPITDDLDTLHHCDNPPCCNPAHLFLGTHADNMADRDAKGRGHYFRGEQHPMAKLKSTDIPVIRELLRRGVYGFEVARRYSVAATTISAIKTGQHWRHIHDS